MAFPITTIFQKLGFRSTGMNLSDHILKAFRPKRLTILSVSLVNGHFRAMSIINDSIHQTWNKPGVIRGTNGLRQAISEAIHHTQFPGTYISFLIEDPRMDILTLHLPVMPLTDLLPILDRKAQQEKTWEGLAACRYHLGIEGRGKQHVCIEMCAQHFIDEITHICEDLKLQLQHILPISSLSESQLSSLPINPNEASVLITMISGKVIFVAGKEDGSPILIRHLAPAQDWVPLAERIGTEINRTIMFIGQQTNLNIPQIWFLGEDKRLTLEEVQPFVSTTILPCPVNPDWEYWLWVGATLPLNHNSNFTPAHVLRAPMRNVFTQSVAAIIAGLLIFSVGATALIEGYFAKNHESLQVMTQQVHALQQDQERWQGQLVALQNKRQWAQSVTGTHSHSIEGPFLGYLGTILPQHTILLKASITRTKKTWDVELTGNIATNLSESLSLMEHFTTKLADGPYHMRVETDWRDQLLTQTATSSPNKKSQSPYRFTLKGQIT